MDRNTTIGIVLIFLLLYVWAKMNAPSPEELAEMQRVKDSFAMAESPVQDSLVRQDSGQPSEKDTARDVVKQDSLQDLLIQRDFGAFAEAAKGTEQTTSLENEVIKVDFSSKGGKIKSALIKPYKKLIEDAEHNDIYLDLFLLEDDKNKFEYLFPVANAPGGFVKSSDLYFTPERSGNTLTLTADLGNGRSIRQVYTLGEGYDMDYQLILTGLDRILNPNQKSIKLNWVNYLDKIEKNTKYEKIYSTVYYKEVDEDPSYCSQSRDDQEVLTESPIKWISHSNQFFNSTLVGDDPFSAAVVESKMLDENSDDLKLLTASVDIPFSGSNSQTIDMSWYIGPNKFELLQAQGHDMEDIVPFGWSVFGTINRWVIRPIFSFLSQFVGSKGIVILLLTLVVKSLVYPLTYRMLYSQSKMSALKPQIEKVREKHKDDQQQVQMETMKMYREYGVNPAGGCFPMILQMPIWFALYRFFPASIEFRQASFLWANDLSSYDVFFRLPFSIPFLGDHISLFTFLWAISMIGYTYYNSKMMDMSSMNAMPAMKYMQYIMPLMFVFFFNDYASGLTCYLLFSNLLNIGQTLVTKNYVINHEKIMEELDANRKKPKKKGGFQERLEKAMKEQQRIAAEKAKKK
ncbi:MAG: membrane protein insertase YidC [Saprospiraceae bacterium]|nr:membrane protein insertase YidC [Saprospiraceae bacterium]